MQPYLLQNNFDKISRFDHSIFYCINENGHRMPVGVVNKFLLSGENIIEFSVSNFPVLEQSWNVFAAELHFYKKGLPFNMTLHGTAWFVSPDELAVQFKILHTECFGREEEKPYSLHESLTDFISNTGVFFKKMLVTGF